MFSCCIIHNSFPRQKYKKIETFVIFALSFVIIYKKIRYFSHGEHQDIDCKLRNSSTTVKIHNETSQIRTIDDFE